MDRPSGGGPEKHGDPTGVLGVECSSSRTELHLLSSTRFSGGNLLEIGVDKVLKRVKGNFFIQQ